MKKRAFTLAEILSVVVILGIVAAITIPSAIKHNSKSISKTKIKKAMAAYERFVQTAKIENNLYSINDFENFKNNNNCEASLRYFKINRHDAQNPCMFRTSDGLWWNLNPGSPPVALEQMAIVSTDREKLTENNPRRIYELVRDLNDNDLYAFTVSVDQNGAFRVNDYDYEMKACGSKGIGKCLITFKVFNYINDGKLLPSVESLSNDSKVVTRNCNNAAKLCGLGTDVKFLGKTKSEGFVMQGTNCDMYGNNCTEYKTCGYGYCQILLDCDNDGNGCRCKNPNSAYCAI